MPTQLPPFRVFVDPRGRSDRRGLLVVTLAVLAVQAVLLITALATGLYPNGPLSWALEGIMFWLAVAATARRLHDCGRPAWWIAAGALAVMAWCFVLTTGILIAKGPLAFAPGSEWLTLTIAAVTLPTLAIMVWLHCEPGDGQVNRYGPVPDASGFSEPTRGDGRVSAGTLARAA